VTPFRPLRAVLLLIAAMAIAGPFWAVFVFKPAPASLAGAAIDTPIWARFDAMAQAACTCARKTGSNAGIASCWREFDEAVAPYQPSEEGSLGCVLPTRHTYKCFGPNCQFAVFVDRSSRGVCTKEEHGIVLAIWLHETRGAPGNHEPANKAVERAIEAFRRGEKVVEPRIQVDDVFC